MAVFWCADIFHRTKWFDSRWQLIILLNWRWRWTYFSFENKIILTGKFKNLHIHNDITFLSIMSKASCAHAQYLWIDDNLNVVSTSSLMLTWSTWSMNGCAVYEWRRRRNEWRKIPFPRWMILFTDFIIEEQVEEFENYSYTLHY